MIISSLLFCYFWILYILHWVSSCCIGSPHNLMVYFNLFCRKVQQPPLSIKDQEEKVKRSSFIQGLLLSTILDDNL